MNRKKRRIFFTSFFSTLCILMLLIGMAEVDYQSRRIGFGDNRVLTVQITGKTWDECCNAVKTWYNDFVSTLKDSAVEESQ
ncbi:MAG TPA: hypothetical protein VHP54_06755 [Caproiciproducens sp.]|jgi:hypothetical protein|nr:hypothetical protein [Caproiciproducens sp.]